MKNNQLLPFERNRYYPGKMLTSADFTAEQLYMNNKRRFLNSVLYGTGVLCGLNVLGLDDVSLLVESGAAIDGAGREILVPKSVVKKLSALKGYDSITGDRAYLCLRYKEEDVYPAFCAAAEAGEEEYQCSRIDEGYELFLTDAAGEESAEREDEFFLEESIFEDEELKLAVKMPLFVSKEKEVKISFHIYNKSEGEKEISFAAKLLMPVFLEKKGRHELEINLTDIKIPRGQQWVKDYWAAVEQAKSGRTSIILKREHAKLVVENREMELEKDIHFEIFLEDLSPEELSMREFGKVTWEKKQAPGTDTVRLAELFLVRREFSCIIGDIREAGVKEYIAAPAQRRQSSTYLSYFRDRYPREYRTGEEIRTGGLPPEKKESTGNMAFGRVEIPLSTHMKKGDICYSQEIMHGLGKGNVYVEVGVECLEDDLDLNRSIKTTVYGDLSLFKMTDCMEFQTAVKVMNDKGSFQIGAKLMGEQKSIILPLSWAAIRFPSGRDSMEAQEERSIVPKVSTVRLKTKERYFFEVEFKNMEKQHLTYELTEEGSGEIGGDGVYIAPAKEGVYEIYIYCTDMPKISTYVYAIVTR